MKITKSWFRQNSPCDYIRDWTLTRYPNGVQASELVEALWDEYRSWAAWIVARWSDAPGALVKKLAEDANWRVRSVIAKRPHLSAVLTKQLAGDADSWVRMLIAKRS